MMLSGISPEISEDLRIDTLIPNVGDSLDAIFKLRPQLTILRENGYATVFVKRFYQKDSLFYAEIETGKQYIFSKISPGNLPESYLDRLELPLLRIEGDHLTPERLESLLQSAVNIAIEDGYPFASCRLDSISLDTFGQLSASLLFDQGPEVILDSIIMEGETPITNAYLERYLGYTPGEKYRHSRFSDIDIRLQELVFLESKQSSKIRFINQKAHLVLNLEEKNASRFDVIIGLLPNISNPQGYNISGDITLEMQNKLNRGEFIFIEFERLRPETQKLDINFEYPFILDLPFGVSTNFNLFRNENKHIDVSYDLGVQYFLNKLNQVKFYWKYESSRLLDIDTSQILNTLKLPDRLDVQTNNFGASFVNNKLDYRLNPRKGYRVRFDASAGVKSILENNQILELSNEENDFTEAYDSLNLRSTIFNFRTFLEYFIPVGNQYTLMFKNNSALKFGNAPVYLNEYYRIGGNKYLRGFDEQSIPARFYSIFTAEFRMLLSTNSHLFVFGDYAFVNNELEEAFKWDRPASFGAGMNFETQAGIFGISIANGKERDMSFDFRNTKTHFGFISLF